MLEGEQGSFAEPTGDTSGIDADAVLSELESSSQVGERAMSQPKADAAPAKADTSITDLAFTHDGKEIRAALSDPRIKQWLSQGYSYNQRMAEFNKQQAEFQAKAAKVSEYETKYSPVEKYIEQNPDWWKHVNEQYQQAKAGAPQGSGVNPADPVVQKLSAYEQELSQIKEFIASTQAEKAQAHAKQEDDALSQEIQSVRDTYADLDWLTPNESGKTLELRVLEHARENGISKFGPAFKDLMHEELIKRAELRGKENVVKERQAQTKLGLLGKSQAPRSGLTEAQDIKKKSYDQLTNEAIQELGITLSG